MMKISRNTSDTKDRVRGVILGVCGSRTLSDERVRILLLEAIDKHKPECIVTHAEPEGVCRLAQQVCKDIGLPLKLHFLNFRHGRGAFFQRSKQVLIDSTVCIFIHDGESKGTTNELAMAKKMNVPSEIHILTVTPYKASVGFDPIDWADDLNLEWDVDLSG